MTDRLVIFGDSWGTGAWSTPDRKIVEGDGYFDVAWGKHFSSIKNYSKGNYSLSEIIATVESYFKHESLKNDVILVIQTDPLRNLVKYEQSYNLDTTAIKSLKSMTSGVELFNVIHIILEMFYFKLNMLGLRNDKKINIIGGCSDVSDRHQVYEALFSPCSSWIKLLDNNHQPSIFYRSTNFEVAIKDTPSETNLALVEQLISKTKIIHNGSGNMFGWNNDPHPSHLGIDKLVTEIHNKLERT